MEENNKEEVIPEKVENNNGNGKEKNSGFFSRLKKSFNDSILESNIKSSYEKAHRSFDVYTIHDNIFGGTARYGELKDGYLSFFGTDEIEENSVVIDSKDNKAYYAKGKNEKIKVYATVDDNIYERPGYRVELDPNAVEVKVIKADKRYFLYPENK